MEEQCSAGSAERQVTKLVEDDEIGVGEPRRDLAGFPLKLLLFESVDEFDSEEKADALAVMLDGLDADRGGEMRLPRAGAADQDDIMGVIQELAAVELTRERLVDLAAGEVEAGKIAIVWKAGGLELIGHRSHLSVGRLRLQELLRHARIALDHGVLHFDRAAHRVDHAAELDKNAVSGALDDAPMVDRDGRIDQVASERPSVRRLCRAQAD